MRPLKRSTLAIWLPLLAPAAAMAQTFQWVGPAVGGWSVDSNWSGGAIPESGSIALIDGGAAQNSNVTLDITTTIRSVTVSAGDTLNIAGGSVLNLVGASSIDGTGGAGHIIVGTPLASAQMATIGGLTLGGGGTIELVRRSRFTVGNVLNLANYSLVGTGSIPTFGISAGTLSLIEARPMPGGTGTLATLDVTAPSQITTSGILSALGGATLNLDTPLITRKDFQPNGTLQAAAGGTILLPNDLTLRNMTLKTTGNGVIIAPANELNNRLTLENVTSSADFRSERLQHTFTGSLTNSGTLTLAAAGGSVVFSGGGGTISGGGLMRFNDVSMTGATTATLQHTSHTIRGYSTLGGIGIGTLINTAGLIESDTPGKRLALSQTTLLGNSGTLSAVNGGELLLTGTAPLIDNRFGRIVARGAGSRVLIDHATRVFGGAIETDEAGEVVFDAPAGTLTLDNSVNTGRLRLHSGTLSAGASGSIINVGTITTSGTITLESTITLQGTGQFNANSLIPNYGIINLGNRIGGSGTIESLDNRSGGIVNAAGTALGLKGKVRNAGIMRASGGGTLYIQSPDNTGGRIEAAAGSRVRIEFGMTGGTLAALSGGSVTPGLSATTFGNGVTLLGPGTFGGVAGQVPVQYALSNGQSFNIGDNPVLDRGTFTLSGSGTVNLIGTNRAVTFKDAAVNFGAATLNIGPGTLHLQGKLINRANINLLGTGTENFRIVPAGTVTLTGAGTIYNAGGAGSGRLVNVDNTIYLGAGSFGAWDDGWENYGSFRGLGGTSNLGVRASLATTVNRGSISSAPLGRLDVFGLSAGALTATIDNAGGVLASAADSTIALQNIAIIGGTLDASVGQIIVATGGRANIGEVTIFGQGLSTGAGTLSTLLPVENKSTGRASRTIDNYVTLAPGALLTVGDPNIDGGRLAPGNVAFTGSGSIRVLPRGTIGGTGLDGFGRLTLDGVTLYGAGTLGTGSMSFVINPNAAIIARPLPEVAGDAVMNLRSGDYGITNNGLISVETGARLNLLPGPPFVIDTIVGGTGSITVQAGGVLSASGAIDINSRPVFNDGTLIISVSPGFWRVASIEGAGRTTVALGGLFAGKIRQTQLSIEGGAVSISESGGTSRLGGLSIAPTRSLNIKDASLVIDYDAVSPFDQVRAWIISGYNAGAWNGPGIRSGNAAVVSRRTAVGYALASELSLPGNVFQGETVDSTTVLIRYTLIGDADLSGTVNLDDFTRMVAGFGNSSVWTSGDFNYDGITDLNDFTALATNFGSTLPADAPARGGLSLTGNAVPEPAASAMLLLLGLAGRRRRPSQPRQSDVDRA